MSDRFVRGWSVSAPSFAKLVSSKKVTAKAVLANKANARVKREVFMMLGDGDGKEAIAEGTAVSTRALTGLLGGKLDKKLTYEYARVLELLLNHIATPLGKTEATQIYLGYTYYVPNKDFGRWNPLLKALKLPTLAKLWAAETLRFPWKQPITGWPTWTELSSADLAKIAGELAPLDRAALDTLPADQLSHDGESAAETRDELWEGLAKLRGWVKKVPEGGSLVLLMDGDQ